MKRDLLDQLRCPFTGGPFTVDAVDEVGDDLRHGLLRSEIGVFPVVAGIPILRRDLPGFDVVAEHVLAGDFDAAARRAAFGDIAPSGLARLGGWLADTERLRPLGRRATERHHARLDERARTLTDPDGGVQDLFALAYRDLHLRNPEVYEYNWHRFALPRQLAALAVLEWAPRQGPVLDVACGAGHLTWALGAALGPSVPVIGVDGLFFALYVAKTRIAPDAELLCVDLESLPFADGSIGGIWASDVLHALRRKVQVWRELARVGGPDAWGAAIWLAVAGTDHHQPARPLSLAGYERLLPDEATFLAGDALLDAYLGGHAADRAAAGDLAASPTATAVWDPKGDARDGHGFVGWPHARGDLGVNPLYEVTGRTDTGTELRLHLPTDEFSEEHAALRRYTPDTALLTDAAAIAGQAGDLDDPNLARLVQQFVVLGFPPGYLDEPWAAVGADA